MMRHKMLLPLGQTTVVEQIVEQLLRSIVDDVVVVVGHEGKRIEDLLERTDARVVYNKDFREGMLSSVRTGITACDVNCQGILLALGDQPSIHCSVVDKLVEKFQAGSGQILVPVYDGRRGHPLLFDALYCQEIMSCFDDTGLRGLMERHADKVATIETDTDDVLRDMDYPLDYERERRAFEARGTG